MILVQIGAGSANFDTDLEDGFSNFIKKKKIKKKKIYIVEANSKHLKNLKKFYSKEKTEILNFAVIPDNLNKKKMVFYYSEQDKPNYQIFSSSKLFVRKHYPNGKIKKKIVNCIKISNLLKKYKLFDIDYLSLDIEGMDYDVLFNLNLNNFKIKNISFEHLHLNLYQKIKIIYKLILNNYFFSGMGFDIRKSDWMFKKNYKNSLIITYLLPFTPRRIWKKYSFAKLN
tara:strand:- start:1841 stop:2521 length:681 start_codon:yes stop_codon:yes gene_type:complete